MLKSLPNLTYCEKCLRRVDCTISPECVIVRELLEFTIENLSYSIENAWELTHDEWKDSVSDYEGDYLALQILFDQFGVSSLGKEIEEFRGHLDWLKQRDSDDGG